MSDPNSPDSNPADENRPQSSPPPGPWLPPRLRDKLESAADSVDDWKPKTGSPVPAIVTISVVLVASVGGFLWWRSATQKNRPGKNATAQAATQPPAHEDSLAAMAHADSMARADSLSRAATPSTAAATGKPGATGATTPKAAPPSPAATHASKSTASNPAKETGGASQASAPAPARGFGIVVGSYLFEDKAQSELTRLQGVTGLTGQVSPGATSGFNVILGKFPTKSAAEKKATAFVDSSLVNQAQVVALPR